MHVVLVSFLLSVILIVFSHYETYGLPVPPLLFKDVPQA